MTSLLDIGPLTGLVHVRDKEVEVRGISGKVFFHLLDDFPELRKLMSGAGIEIKPEHLLKQVPGAVSSVIAAACGHARDKDAIAAADDLTIGEQTEFLVKIWELTFPRGVGRFTAALEGIMRATGSGWAPGMPSPEQSSNSSIPDTQEPGTTPPG